MRKKLLLADDSITIQKVVELTFPSDEFEVVTAGNGRLAVDKAATFQPDIVLCDVIMPQMDGYQVCEALRAMPTLADVPILLLNGAFEPYDPDRARAAGALGNVSKPFDPPALVAKVKEILASRPEPAPAPPAETVPVPPDEQGPSAFTWDETEATAISTMDVPNEAREAAARSMALDTPVFAEPEIEPEIEAPAADLPETPVTNLSATLHDSLETIEPISSEGSGLELEPESAFDAVETTTAEVSLSASSGAYEAGFMEEPASAVEAETSSPGDELEFEPKAADSGMPKTLPPMVSPFVGESPADGGREPEQEFEAAAFEATPAPPAPEPDMPPDEPLPTGFPEEPTASPLDFGAGPSDVTEAAPEPEAPNAPEAPESEVASSWPAAVSEPDVAATLAPPALPEPVGAAEAQASEVAVPVDMVQQIAQRVISQVSERVIREIAWDVIPALAEKLIKAEIERIKARAENERD